jgi:cytochrome c oxidase subunit 4
MNRAAEKTPWAVWRPNLVVWAALLGLLTLTWYLAYIPLGRFQLAAALGIALVKVALVAVVFMQLRTSSPLIRLAAGAGLFWLTLMFVLAFSDFLTRFR